MDAVDAVDDAPLSKRPPLAPRLVQDGGEQAFPPDVLPPPRQLPAELKAMQRDDGPRRRSMGPHFSRLDERLLSRILRRLDPIALLRCTAVCRWLHVYANDDTRWKRLAIKRFGGAFHWKRCWKWTALMAKTRDVRALPAPYVVRVARFYSPELYLRHYRSHVPLDALPPVRAAPPLPPEPAASATTPTPPTTTTQPPPPLADDMAAHRVPLVYAPSVAYFTEHYAVPNRPCVIRGALEAWPARRAWRSVDALLDAYACTDFKTDEVDAKGRKFRMRFDQYVAYMRANADEDPIYLFDPRFVAAAPALRADYDVPALFPDDFFAVMGEQERPDYRWLVIGGARSGSSFHVDPYQTSAWNALLCGRKRWALYPPSQPPPGVRADADAREGVSYDAPEVLKYMVHTMPFIDDAAWPMECVQEAGDLIFVPAGWWHMVLNLEETVAVTQNFAAESNFQSFIDDLTLPSSMHVFEDWLEAFEKVRPDLVAKFRLRERLEQSRANADDSSSSSGADTSSSSTSTSWS